MDEFKLSDITIGYADGEKEASKANFENLFYTKNKKYEQIMKKDKFIISGRKGTGKTILTKYIQKTDNKDTTIIQYSKLNEISLHQYIELEKPDIDNDTRLLFQEYYIYKQYILTIIDHKLQLKNFMNNCFTFKEYLTAIKSYFKYVNRYNKIKDFYNQLYPKGLYKTDEIKTIETIVDASTSTIKANIGISLETTANEKIELSKEVRKSKKHFTNHCRDMKKLINDILECIDVIIIIDDLDEIKLKDSEHVIHFLINFVMRVNQINMDMANFSEKSKCILLLRSDIINLFASKSSNIQKIMTDSTVELQWFKDRSGDELSNMIMYKIKNSANNSSIKNLDLEEIRKLLFPITNNTDAFTYMLNHSFGRPRDLVTYINTIIEQYPDEKKFTVQMAKNAEATYSKNFYFELRNEINFTIQEEAGNEFEKMFRSISKKRFSYQQILTHYNNHKLDYQNIDNLDDYLELLYKFGVIGNYQTVNKQSIYSWSYRNGGDHLDKNKTIIIHAGLYKYLNI